VVFDFVTGQDLCTGTYFNNAIPVVRFPFPSPHAGAFKLNTDIADRPPDRQAGIPHGHLAQHHLRMKELINRIARFSIFCTRPPQTVVLLDGSVLNCCTDRDSENLFIRVRPNAVIVFRPCFRHQKTKT
jgi:hypothetical protein